MKYKLPDFDVSTALWSDDGSSAHYYTADTLRTEIAAAERRGAKQERKRLADKEHMLTDAELADPVYMKAYTEDFNETITELLSANKASLAAAHGAAQAAKVPLTEAQILALEKQTPAMNDAAEEWIYFARAIEAAHGIGEQA